MWKKVFEIMLTSSG